MILRPSPPRSALRLVRPFRRGTEKAWPVDQFRRKERGVFAALDIRIDRTVTKIPNADEANLAYTARSDDLPRLFEVVSAAPLVADLYDLPGCPDRCHHLVAFGNGARERLLDVSILACTHCVNQALAVQMVGCGDYHAIDIFAREQVFVINIGFIDR